MLRAVVIVMGLANMVGLADLVLRDDCEDVCKGDDCQTHCPPGQACRCHCPSAMPMVSGVAQASALRSGKPSPIAAIEWQRRAHASPDPREILHVPRHAA